MHPKRTPKRESSHVPVPAHEKRPSGARPHLPRALEYPPPRTCTDRGGHAGGSARTAMLSGMICSRGSPAARPGERESGAAPTRAPAGRATAPRSTAARPAARAARCANRPGRHCGRSPPRGRVRAVARNVRAFTRARRTRPARRRCQRQLRRGSLAARTHWVRDAQCSRLMRDTSAQRAFRAARGHRSVWAWVWATERTHGSALTRSTGRSLIVVGSSPHVAGQSRDGSARALDTFLRRPLTLVAVEDARLARRPSVHASAALPQS